MRRVTYKSVLEKASLLYTGELEPSVENAGRLNVHLNMRAGEYWEFFYWPEFCLHEQRQFRADWSALTTYGAPSATAAVEVYFPKAQKYYQSLRAANLNNAPATGTSLTENSAWWAEAKPEYSGDDWADATVYTVGRIIKNPDDQRYYQCHTAHTSAGSFDATKFGLLTAFIRDIDYEQTGRTAIGEVKEVWDRDPRAFEEQDRCKIEKELFETGIVVRGTAPLVWVEFRIRVPSWTGAAYAAATTYALNDQVYDSTTGDFYKSAQGANTGHAVTDTAWWTRIDFPYVLRDCVPQAAYADALRVSGQQDKYLKELAYAEACRDREIRKITLKQGQQRQLPVMTRMAA